MHHQVYVNELMAIHLLLTCHRIHIPYPMTCRRAIAPQRQWDQHRQRWRCSIEADERGRQSPKVVARPQQTDRRPTGSGSIQAACESSKQAFERRDHAAGEWTGIRGNRHVHAGIAASGWLYPSLPLHFLSLSFARDRLCNGHDARHTVMPLGCHYPRDIR